MNAATEPRPIDPAGLPRWVEAPIATLLLLLVSPLVVVLALAAAITSAGPAFFRQWRVGKEGRPFLLMKLRTMHAPPVAAHAKDATGATADRHADSGTGSDEAPPEVTAAGDPRITGLGRFLRATKLDELPELWHVVVGEMSFVGPRPEVPAHVDLEDPLWQRVLRARPGLTDPVTLRLRNEEALMAAVPETERDEFYRRHLQPWKLRGYARYLDRRDAWTDLAVLGHTVVAVLFPGSQPPPTLDELAPLGDRLERVDRPVGE